MIILGPMKMLGLGKSFPLEKPPSLMTSSRWLPSRADARCWDSFIPILGQDPPTILQQGCHRPLIT